MPFWLKNAGVTYQRLVNQMFAQQIDKTMKVYVDNMLIKSLHANYHLAHLKKMFNVLHTYNIKLNPSKCAFKDSLRKFLGFMVNQWGIKANPNKIKAIMEMEALQTVKEVQRLIRKIVTFNYFVSRATVRCLPFFQILKKSTKFEWTPKYEEVFI